MYELSEASYYEIFYNLRTKFLDADLRQFCKKLDPNNIDPDEGLPFSELEVISPKSMPGKILSEQALITLTTDYSPISLSGAVAGLPYYDWFADKYSEDEFIALMEKEAKAIADKKVKPFVQFLDRLLASNRFRNFRLKSHKVDFSVEPYSKDRDDMLENPGYNFYVSVELELL